MRPDLSALNFSPSEVFYNLSYEDLYKHECRNGEGTTTANGTFAIDTGEFTGRSPKDKYFVEEEPFAENIWWGPVNQSIRPEIYDDLKRKVFEHLEQKDIYVTDGYSGASLDSRLNVRIVSEYAWQSHFCKNMFIRPEDDQLSDFLADFTIVDACNFKNENWQAEGLNSSAFVIFSLKDKLAIIGGTSYGGERKKGIFSVMHYYLPLRDILTMHCSANQGKDGSTALFFGLSGTGKTTLSADPHRFLIGDDEHGWDEKGIFNLEGGCYAKTINLSEKTEPDIYRAIRRDALLENVVIEPGSKKVDYTDDSKTKNTRVSYPVYHIDNALESGVGTHPSQVIFLTCDAFGVLPPVAKLTNEQAMYYFLSGYTAKVAGTERGVTEPIPDFSPCFGGPFLTLHPTVYAHLLGEKLKKHGSSVYLINTGWTGGAYGEGHRIDLPSTRKLVDAILDGSIEETKWVNFDIFNFAIPESLPGLDKSLLCPKASWEDKAAYDGQRLKLAGMFQENYKKYQEISTEFCLAKYGPEV